MQRLFIWVEIPVGNMERAKTFYEQLFQIEMPKMAMGDCDYAFFPVQERFNGGLWFKVRITSQQQMASLCIWTEAPI
jgi:predicted enzyme related to lactoylglutathione lyase